MKFGKRLASEAARRWRPCYLDYKAIKRAIECDVQLQDPQGQKFRATLQRELEKVNKFYTDQEQGLEAQFADARDETSSSIAQLRSEISDLHKFAVLNYIAVIKACKKRNRHLQAVCQSQAGMTDAVDLLSAQYFFTSPKLANLATEAEILAQERGLGHQHVGEQAQDYQCAICLDVLHNPVVLTCAHRYCWGCLVAHLATVVRNREANAVHGGAGTHANDKKVKGSSSCTATGANRAVARAHVSSGVETYDCPVCRKAQVLDVDRLQVDVHLANHISSLKLQERSSVAASVSVSAAAVPQQSLALTLPLRRPELAASQTAVAATSVRDTGLKVQAPEQASALKPPRAPCKTASLQRLPTEPMPEQAPAVPTVQASSEEPPLLPPQRPEHKGRLTVVLDLDGTLISSFTPRRAPRLTQGVTTHLVGRGSQLNPNGVFVVERPGLQEFLSRLSSFAEVVLFTAGLEDYAKPITDALDHCHKACFQDRRLFRPATVACDLYPCIKDLSRLGRDMRRIVLIDDTPLAFLKQPNNGIPIYGFRGDVDDRVLTEAMLPLLEALSQQHDVRPTLHKRFNMPQWFKAQGVSVEKYSAPKPVPSRPAKMPLIRANPDTRAVPRARAVSDRAAPEAAPQQVAMPSSSRLLLCDFDKTVADFDAGEQLVEELAPELVPMLASLESPANFVPLTNAVMAEMARRGVDRQQILTTLRRMGEDLPEASTDMIKWAHQEGIQMRIMSDCNTVFIHHMLKGAGIDGKVTEVLTNLSSFVRCQAASSSSQSSSSTSNDSQDASASDSDSSQLSSSTQINSAQLSRSTQAEPAAASGLPESAKQVTWDVPSQGSTSSLPPASHKLVVQPRHDYTQLSHGCPMCPANLCKGLELKKLRAALPFQRIVFCGDGANDLCPALALGADDTVLARQGFALDKLIAARAELQHPEQQVVAKVHVWKNHSHMLQLVKAAMAST